jgi:hypothetical protein
MHYYKFLKYNLCLVDKVVGVIQFKEHMAKKKLETIGADHNLFFELQPVTRPMIIPHLRIRLLCQHHNCLESEIYERGTFSFGGRGASIADIMRPYIILLNDFKRTGDVGHGMHLADGVKICLYAGALDRLPYDAI